MSDFAYLAAALDDYSSYDDGPGREIVKKEALAALDRLEARLATAEAAAGMAEQYEKLAAEQAQRADAAEAERDRARTDVLRYPGLSAVAAERDAARADAGRLAEALRKLRRETKPARHKDGGAKNGCVWCIAAEALAAHDNAEEGA